MKPSHIKGFTLIELLVVISIISMLASVILVSLQGARDKGRLAAAELFDENLYQTMGADAIAHVDPSTATMDPTGCGGYGSISLDIGSDVGGTGGSCGAMLSLDTPLGNGQSMYFSTEPNSSMSIQFARAVQLNAFTASVWVKPTTGGAIIDAICTTNCQPAVANSKEHRIFLIYVGSTGLLEIGDNCQYSNPSPTIPINKWSLVTLTYSGTDPTKNTYSIYIDGHLYSSYSGCGTLLNDGVIDQVRIHGNGSQADDMQDMYIDSVSLYPHSISN